MSEVYQNNFLYVYLLMSLTVPMNVTVPLHSSRKVPRVADHAFKVSYFGDVIRDFTSLAFYELFIFGHYLHTIFVFGGLMNIKSFIRKI